MELEGWRRVGARPWPGLALWPALALPSPPGPPGLPCLCRCRPGPALPWPGPAVGPALGSALGSAIWAN